MLDLIIVGAGPAGITASVYAARKKMDFAVITKDIGGQAAWSGDIENYTGYQFISGPDLAAKFEEHMKNYNIKLKENEEVTLLEKRGNIVFIKSDKDSYEAKAAIIASGKRSKELGIIGEKEFKYKGLTYCATCDAPLFSGKDVAVIGGGNSGLDATLQLIKIAKKIYLINIASELTGDPIMQEKVEKSQKVSILNNTKVTAILGQGMVGAIKIDQGGKEKTLDVKGVFIEIGLIPNSDFVKGIDKNDKGEIKINCLNQTSASGVFAAGDVTDVREKQIIIASGGGANAALGAFRYINSIE